MAFGVYSMTTPTYHSTTVTDFGADATTHLANMPATVNGGELLLAVAAFDGSTSITVPTGWTNVSDVGGDPVARVCAKIATGSEGGTTVDFVTSNVQRGSVHVLRISKWHGALDSLRAMNAFTGTTAIVALMASTVSRDYLFVVAQIKSSTAIFGTGPSGWANETLTGVGENDAASAAIATATRAVTGTNAEANPLWIVDSGQPTFMIAITPGLGGKGSGGKGKGGNTPGPGEPPKKPLRTSLSKSWKWDRGWR
jgi:hypothetical protein